MTSWSAGPTPRLQGLLDGTQPKGRRYYWKSEYLAGIEPELCDTFTACAAKIPSPHSAVILFQLGGAINKLPNEHSPMGNRDARYVLNIGGSWEQPADDAANIGWARDTWNALKQYSTGGNYINFLTEDEGAERVEAALGAGMARLREVKAAWDPENFFRTNRNIKPRA